MKILGIERTSFKAKDSGETISGINLYVGEDIPADKGSGYRSERVFLTDKRVKSLDITLQVGKSVRVLYNRYGKVASIDEVVDEDDI